MTAGPVSVSWQQDTPWLIPAILLLPRVHKMIGLPDEAAVCFTGMAAQLMSFHYYRAFFFFIPLVPARWHEGHSWNGPFIGLCVPGDRNHWSLSYGVVHSSICLPSGFLNGWLNGRLDGRKDGGPTRRLGLIMLTSILILKTDICSPVRANKRVVLSFKWSRLASLE